MLAEPKKSEIILSVDGEFTGPIPGRYSMIALGAVAYTTDGRRLGHFRENLKELPGSERDPETMAWWAKHPEAWEAATRDPVPPTFAMEHFAMWVTALGGSPKLAGWPLPVDFMFIYWYYVHFLRKIPKFGYDGIDIKSVAMSKFSIPNLYDVSRSEIEKRLGLPSGEFTHDPREDAERQGELYFAILKHDQA